MTYLTLFDRRKLFFRHGLLVGRIPCVLGGSIKKDAYYGNGV